MRRSIARSARAAGFCFVAASAFACGGAPPAPHPAHAIAPPPTAKTATPRAPSAESASWLPSRILAKLDDESSAPYFARRSGGALLFYSSQGRWLTRALGEGDKPLSDAPLDVGPATASQMATLKATADGYVAVWLEMVARNGAVKLLALDPQGKPRGEPVLVTQIAEDVSWVDVLPNAKGALVVWETSHEDKRDVFVVPVLGSKVDGAPAVAARDVIGWEARATERGAAIASIVATPQAAPVAAPTAKGKRKAKIDVVSEAADARGSKLGRVLFTEIDVKGRASAPVVVSAEPTAQIDIEITEVGGKYLLAWTDERAIDPAVFTASVELGGKIAVAPHRATAPIGEQALVSLIAGSPSSKRALLGWEDQLRTPRGARIIHLATIGADGTVGRERASLVFSASGPPDLVADGDGFAAVTLAPALEAAGDEALPGESAKKIDKFWPWYVRFGADLGVIAAEPIRSEPFASSAGAAPYLTRYLTCSAGACTTIANDAGAGAPLALVSLPGQKTASKPPATRDVDDAPPRPSSVTALFDGDHLASVDGADLPGGGALAAWVTYYLDGASERGAKKGKEEGPFATVSVRPIGAEGTPGKTTIISHKALSIGGVAVAPAPVDKDDAKAAKKPETVIAWVARDKNEPQVFVTKVGPDGAKLAQKGVTVVSRKSKKGSIPSEVSDVAIAADGAGGWIVAWGDTRDGNLEIYVARLDRSLNKVVPDRRITEAPGNSAEVQLVVRGKDVFLVWSDARQNPDDGKGDIYLARLDATTLKKAGPERRVFASASHSRTPRLALAGDGFLLSWIEDASDDAAATDRGLRIAQLDAAGTVIGAPQLVRGEGQGAVTSAALGCQSAGPRGSVSCRGVLTTAVGESVVLGAFAVNPGAAAGPLKTIAELTGPATQDPSPVFTGASATSLLFTDDAVGGSGRVRWMQIAWP